MNIPKTRFYKQIGDEYPRHVIIGDSTYCRIKTEEVYKGQPGEPVVEGTTFCWVIHGGNFSDSQSFFSRVSSDYERLYSLDVLGVRDRGEDDEFDVYTEFTVQGLLTSKSRISKSNTMMPRLELVAGQMAVNMTKNVRQALNRWPVSSITIWMDSTVALYWLTSPGRNWKVFVANRAENRKDNRRAQYFLEILPNRQEHSRSRK